jgi:epoxyqueuosine reductase
MALVHFEEITASVLLTRAKVLSALNLQDTIEVLDYNRKHLETWQEHGYAADMKFMQRPPELFCDIRHFLPEAKSLLVFALPYSVPGGKDPECPRGFGRIARYARGRDYHKVFRDLLLNILEDISSRTNARGRVFTDAVPLLERALAAGSGLGFIGKSAMNIIPGIGTWFFIGEILLDCEIEGIPEITASKGSCGSCMNCISECPTNAFVGPRVLDAGKCISYLTIEKRSVHSEEEAGMLGDWIFGCDVCQEVCPFNMHGKEVTPWEYFKPEYGVGAFLNIPELLSVRESGAFRKKFSHTPLMRAKREGLIRNGLCVLQNQKASEYYKEVIDCFQNDTSDLIRAQAAQTLNKFLDAENGAVATEIHTVLSQGNALA